MKIIKTIDLKENTDLFGIACAMKEFSLMRKLGLQDGTEEPKSIKFAMDSIMELLHYKFQQIFIDDYSQFAENQFAIGQDDDGIKIRVFAEKYDNRSEIPKDCNNESVGISDMLKDSGLETTDDHIERLADDLKNKRGGQA